MPRRSTRRKPDFEPDEESTTRPFWSGTISFGLVSIPVNLYPATRAPHSSLRMLGPDGTPLSRRYFSSETGKELNADDMIRGFETEKDNYVVVTDEELERLDPEKSRDIDLRVFVKKEEIPPLYFEHAYFLAPAAGGAVKAYQLLAETMESSGCSGIATVVMRDKAYLIAILAEKGILRAEMLRFSDEVRSPGDIGLPKPKQAPKAAVSRFAKLIRQRARDEISPDELRDEYAQQLLKLVERKQERNKDIVESDVEKEKPAKVVDLMEVLKKSLARKKAA